MKNPDQAISKILQPLAKDIANCLEEAAEQKIGFSLVVFPITEQANMQYVSNCKRTEVVDALQSLIDGWRQGMPDIPAHKRQ